MTPSVPSPTAASYAQQTMCAGEQMGGGQAYRMPLAMWFDGDLDVTALVAACGDVVARHPILATTVKKTGDAFTLTAVPAPAVTIAAAAGPAAVEQLIRHETERGFDLDDGPLARFTLAAAGPGRHLLLFVAHHLVFDGLSKDILVRDLARYYRARSAGADHEIVPLSFAAAADDERGRLIAALDGARTFWAARWTTATEVMLPRQRRTARWYGPGEQVDGGTDGELSRSAADVARLVGATTFEVLLAAVQALLMRYGNEQVPVAIVTTTRRAVARDHIGPFVNELPVLIGPAPSQTFRQFVNALRGELRELYQFREVPFAMAVSQPPRGAPTPVSISYRKREPAPDFPGLKFSADWMMFGGGVWNALHIQFVDAPDGLDMALRFDPAAVDRDTVVRFGDGLAALLSAAAADPDARLADLAVMSAAERRAVLGDWNDTGCGYPAEATLPALFADQVRTRPDAVAVTFDDRSLSYAELDAAASGLAGRLRRAGVRRGDLVAVHLRRSDTLLACLLGVHRAGAAYLPLDPDHPAGRIAMIVADAQPRLLVTETAVPDGARVPALLVNPALAAADEPELLPGLAPVLPGPSETAYVIYTSGSTGRPKGVEIEHRSLTNLLLAMRDRLGSCPADAWLYLTSPAFDISALELYLPLITGGRVVVAPQGAVRRPEALARLAAAEGVTHVQATPSVWRLLLPGDIAGVTALAGGEALPPGLAHELRARCHRVINMYGPTETTIWSTCGEPGETVTIGRPIANTQVYLLDAQLRPVPVGVAGELYIGGAGVARGYRGRAALTAERFVPDPFGPPGARLYRTGDLARYRADGELEFLGRLDTQVKLLGHRIELGEIEARLAEHPQVLDAAVALDVTDSDDPRLIAYLVPADPVLPPDPGALIAHLAATLHPAMVPSAFVTLDALPLNPSGKLDRAALPQLAGSVAALRGPVTAQQPDAADQELGEAVRRIWREVLKLDADAEIADADDLFDLGGHSLTIIQITARITELTGVEISLDAVFDDPTIAGMIAEIARLRARAAPAPGESGHDREQVALRPRPAGVNPPLSIGQERLWFLHRFNPDDISYNVFYVVRLRGHLEVSALKAAVDALVARHETLRTSFTDTDGEPVTVIWPPGPFPLEQVDLTGAADAEEQARQLVTERTDTPFDLAEAPPVRISLVTLGRDDHVLSLVLHHIITDGWSQDLLFDELFAAYQAALAGQPPDLPPLPVQYGDIALWQRQRYSGKVLEESLAYWRDRLAGVPMVELLIDEPGDERPVDAFHTVQVPEEVVASLERLAARHGASLFMILVAAYQVLLSRHSGQDDILIATTWATRDRVEMEPVIGYLTEPTVLRGNLSGDPAFTDLLEVTRRTVLEAHAHLFVPFEQLLSEAGFHRNADNSNPMLNTMLVYQSQAGDGLPPERAGDLDVELFLDVQQRPQLDLYLQFWRNDEGLRTVFGYDASRTYAATIHSLAARMATLLKGIAGAPDTPVSRLPMLTEADAVVLGEAGAAALGEPGAAGHRERAETVPALLAEAVAATPHATALIRGAEQGLGHRPGRGPSQVSYAELDARVSLLAAALRKRGIGAGDVVGVCHGRSIDAVVALLAVWRSGGAYLPLDPDYPDERLAYLISDSAVRLVVAPGALGHRLPPGVVLVDADAIGAGQAADGDGQWPAVEPGDPAYVIYTSGSTGQPKGVVVEHAALAGRVRWMREEYGLRPGDRVAQFASLSFDTHAEELYPALTAGASVLLLPDGAISLPDVLREPAGQLVTVLDLPTAYWAQLAESLDDVTWPRPLRLVIIGGEEAHAATVAKWRNRFGDRVELINTYGPTEATIVATACALGAADTTGRPPIGWPAGGTVAHVLGRNGEQVPPGRAGELYLGGAGLARGYLGRPALTAERFVPDPYGPPGSRLYRTGDRVRLRADGRLEFLGRLDEQLKVRGFRVEPGEVTAALLTHPGVREAAVAADGDRLVAYVAGSAGPDELRGHLAARLPAHLVPTAWVPLDALPLTVNGKVDLTALPAPEPATAAQIAAPRTDAEVLVAGVWAAVLGLDAGQIGAHDDFFALGGHSLLATRVAALLRNAVEVDVPIRTVFDQPTVEKLAAAVESLLIEQLSLLSDADAARELEQEARR